MARPHATAASASCASSASRTSLACSRRSRVAACVALTPATASAATASRSNIVRAVLPGGSPGAHASDTTVRPASAARTASSRNSVLLPTPGSPDSSMSGAPTAGEASQRSSRASSRPRPTSRSVCSRSCSVRRAAGCNRASSMRTSRASPRDSGAVDNNRTMSCASSAGTEASSSASAAAVPFCGGRTGFALAASSPRATHTASTNRVAPSPYRSEATDCGEPLTTSGAAKPGVPRCPRRSRASNADSPKSTKRTPTRRGTRRAAGHHQQVRGLDVAVHDAGCVQGFQSVGDARGDVVERGPVRTCERQVRGLTRHELHGVERRAVGCESQLVHRHDGGVTHAREQFELASQRIAFGAWQTQLEPLERALACRW